MICFMSSLAAAACQRDEGVHASGEPETYQPRRAPTAADHVIKGELIQVDLKRRTITVRVENGMTQTLRFTDETVVEGVDAPTQARSLAGKEGSELKIHWEDYGSAKRATTIEVTQLATVKNRRASVR
jgi:hypothetical protein